MYYREKVCVSLQNHSRGSRGRETTWQKHNIHRKELGLTQKQKNSQFCSATQPSNPMDCPQGSLLSHQSAFCHCCKACGEGEGWEQLNPNALRSSPFPGIQQMSLPFQDIVLLEPKLGGFHAPGMKGNVENRNRVKENAKRN